MTPHQLLLKDITDHTMVITLNQPEAANALCQELISQLNQALEEAETHEGIRAIVITGAEHIFSAGADLITRVAPVSQLKEEAVALVQKIAAFSQPVAQMIKEAFRACENMRLKEDLHFERRLFQKTFTLKDQQEGMAAFLEKRKPVFRHE